MGRRPLLSDLEDYKEKEMDLSRDPSKILEEAKISAIVQREIQALPGDQREVLLLSKYSGLSYEEIAPGCREHAQRD